MSLQVYTFQFLASAESIAPTNPKKAALEQIDGMFRTNNTAKKKLFHSQRDYSDIYIYAGTRNDEDLGLANYIWKLIYTMRSNIK